MEDAVHDYVRVYVSRPRVSRNGANCRSRCSPGTADEASSGKQVGLDYVNAGQEVNGMRMEKMAMAL